MIESSGQAAVAQSDAAKARESADQVSARAKAAESEALATVSKARELQAEVAKVRDEAVADRGRLAKLLEQADIKASVATLLSSDGAFQRSIAASIDSRSNDLDTQAAKIDGLAGRLNDLSLNVASLASQAATCDARVSRVLNGTEAFSKQTFNTDGGGVVFVTSENGKLFFTSPGDNPEAGWKITFNKLKTPSLAGISFYDRSLSTGFGNAFFRYEPKISR